MANSIDIRRAASTDVLRNLQRASFGSTYRASFARTDGAAMHAMQGIMPMP